MRELTIADRVSNVQNALFLAEGKVYSYVFQEIGTAGYEALKGIIPALIASLAFVTLTTAVGAGAGAAVGSLGFGVGAVPFGIAGGTLGFKTGLWILNLVGLAFLIEHMGSSLQDAVLRIEFGLVRAWGPRSASDGFFCRDGDVEKAADEIALGIAVIIRCILEGVVLFLTAKGTSKLPELVANLKRSRLGEGFAIWVELNYLQLLKNPRFTMRTGTSAAAQKPTKIIDHSNIPEQPRPPSGEKIPSLRQKYVEAVKSLRKKADKMKEEGYSEEEIARSLHAERRSLGVKFKNATPPNELERIYKRNIEKYGDPLGPSIEYLRSHGKTWGQIIDSACRPGGKDLGY
jgi:hypothetical protein